MSFVKEKVQHFERIRARNEAAQGRNPEFFARPGLIIQGSTIAGVRCVNNIQFPRAEFGSLCGNRFFQLVKRVYKEVLFVCELIHKYGFRVEEYQEGERVISFGTLFNMTVDYSDMLMHILLIARTWQMIDFDGEILFQNVNNDAQIILKQPFEKIKITITDWFKMESHQYLQIMEVKSPIRRLQGNEVLGSKTYELMALAHEDLNSVLLAVSNNLRENMTFIGNDPDFQTVQHLLAHQIFPTNALLWGNHSFEVAFDCKINELARCKDILSKNEHILNCNEFLTGTKTDFSLALVAFSPKEFFEIGKVFNHAGVAFLKTELAPTERVSPLNDRPLQVMMMSNVKDQGFAVALLLSAEQTYAGNALLGQKENILSGIISFFKITELGKSNSDLVVTANQFPIALSQYEFMKVEEVSIDVVPAYIKTMLSLTDSVLPPNIHDQLALVKTSNVSQQKFPKGSIAAHVKLSKAGEISIATALDFSVSLVSTKDIELSSLRVITNTAFAYLKCGLAATECVLPPTDRPLQIKNVSNVKDQDFALALLLSADKTYPGYALLRKNENISSGIVSTFKITELGKSNSDYSANKLSCKYDVPLDISATHFPKALFTLSQNEFMKVEEVSNGAKLAYIKDKVSLTDSDLPTNIHDHLAQVKTSNVSQEELPDGTVEANEEPFKGDDKFIGTALYISNTNENSCVETDDNISAVEPPSTLNDTVCQTNVPTKDIELSSLRVITNTGFAYLKTELAATERVLPPNDYKLQMMKILNANDHDSGVVTTYQENARLGELANISRDTVPTSKITELGKSNSDNSPNELSCKYDVPFEITATQLPIDLSQNKFKKVDYYSENEPSSEYDVPFEITAAQVPVSLSQNVSDSDICLDTTEELSKADEVSTATALDLSNTNENSQAETDANISALKPPSTSNKMATKDTEHSSVRANPNTCGTLPQARNSSFNSNQCPRVIRRGDFELFLETLTKLCKALLGFFATFLICVLLLFLFLKSIFP